MTQQEPRMLQISPEYYGPVIPKDQPAVGTLPNSRLPAGTQRPLLLTELEIPMGDKTFKLKNRASLPPLCMYSSRDGFPSPFHIAHHGQFALHGMGSALVEATAVEPQGRISPSDMGIWKDEHIAAHASLVETVKTLAPEMYFGIQLAHAGRKASTPAPWNIPYSKTPYVEEKDGGWPHDIRGPSICSWIFVVIIQFAFEQQTYRRIRRKFPSKGLWVRINGTDAVEYTKGESWTVESTKRVAYLLEEAGVDVLDVSSGGTVAYNRFDYIPAYQLPLASAVKSLDLKRMKTSTVGALHAGTASDPERIGSLAEKVLQDSAADIISVGRGSLKYPNWVSLASTALTGKPTVGTVQYDYATVSLDKHQFRKDPEHED